MKYEPYFDIAMGRIPSTPQEITIQYLDYRLGQEVDKLNDLKTALAYLKETLGTGPESTPDLAQCSTPSPAREFSDAHR